jgi:histone demethylase JARID1
MLSKYGTFSHSVSLKLHLLLFCHAEKLVCVPHIAQLCECPNSKKCLRYRYTLDELPNMLHCLKVRAESFDNWAIKVKAALEAIPDDKIGLFSASNIIFIPHKFPFFFFPELSAMKAMITEAQEKKFPDSPLLQALLEAVSEAESCAHVAAQLISDKVRTRYVHLHR